MGRITTTITTLLATLTLLGSTASAIEAPHSLGLDLKQELLQKDARTLGAYLKDSKLLAHFDLSKGVHVHDLHGSALHSDEKALSHGLKHSIGKNADAKTKSAQYSAYASQLGQDLKDTHGRLVLDTELSPYRVNQHLGSHESLLSLGKPYPQILIDATLEEKPHRRPIAPNAAPHGYLVD